MSSRTYLFISGTVFGVISLLHLLRVINGWDLVLGPWATPMWVSWGGTLVPGFLCIWAFRLASPKRA